MTKIFPYDYFERLYKKLQVDSKSNVDQIRVVTVPDRKNVGCKRTHPMRGFSRGGGEGVERPLLPGGLFLGRKTQNRPNKNPSGLGNLRPRNWPNSKNAA